MIIWYANDRSPAGLPWKFLPDHPLVHRERFQIHRGCANIRPQLAEVILSEQSDARKPNPVDVHVGRRVKLRRKVLGLSQEHLAASLGLTFQQIQKYERGSNRVSASKLYEMATTMSVPVEFFFDGLPDPLDALGPDHLGMKADDTLRQFLDTYEGFQIAELFPKISQPRVRRQLVDLLRAMSEGSEGNELAA